MMRGFDTYRYRDKAPVIDLLRTAVQVAAAARGTTFKKMLKRIATGIGRREPSMLNAWFFGATHCPQYDSVQAVALWLLQEGFKVQTDDNVVRLSDYAKRAKKLKVRGRKAA